MNKLKKLGVAIIFTAIILLSQNAKAASDFDLEKMDFQAVLDKYGNMKVTETWYIDIDGTTNTLFKTFETDSTKYTGITNVTVTDITDGVGKNLTRLYSLQYHVDTDCYYAMKNSEGDFEIAWGINRSSGNRVYKVSYTVEDAVSLYNDCAELYWQFIGADFTSPIEKVTGTITLPEGVSNIDNLRVWGHGGLNGEINRESKNTVKFAMAPFITGTYLEVRVAVLEPSIFSMALNKSNQNKLDRILSEETAWAEQANKQREKIKQNETIKFIIITIISAIISVVLIKFIIKAYKVIKTTPKMKPSIELEYFRDIPNENSAPSEVGFLYYFSKTGMQNVMPRILSSTMLDLALKKLIEFEMTTDKKPQVIVKLKPNEQVKLKQSEQIIYDLLKKVAADDLSFTMKDFEKYATKHNSSFLSTLNKVEEAAKKEQIEEQNYSQEMYDKNLMWIGKAIFSIMPIMFTLIPSIVFEINIIPVLIVIAISIFYAILCFIASGRFSAFTQKGLDEKEKWQGLKKYMDDFSMIDKREVPELVLWEKYLVYATLFGNADKVLQQLKVVYPEFSNDDYLMNTTYFYLIAHTDFNNSFVRAVDSSMQRAYQSSIASSSSSSGGGFGGGFSGGGGGGRWSAEAAADANFWGRFRALTFCNTGDRLKKNAEKTAFFFQKK